MHGVAAPLSRLRSGLSRLRAPIPRSFTCSARVGSSAELNNEPSPNPPATPTEGKHFYVTTPIFYVNAAPHIGHLHSTVLADVITRFQALRHPTLPPPVLCTGTDEHGLKIQRVAEARKISPQQLCDDVSKRFLDLADKAGVKYDIFIRTTEERHRVAVQHIWGELERRGHIYKSSYEGWYAVSDEAYYSNAQVHQVAIDDDGSPIMASIETGTRVEWMEEDNYKFRLSAFKEPLIAWLSAEPNVLQPPSRTVALLAQLNAPSSSDLLDLSVSRPATRLTWGIPVPGDETQTIYVWIDALVNYLTAAGYPWKGGEAFTEDKLWPPDVMVVGKDIVKFHALYFPAMLLALDLPLPKKLLAHGHWTKDKFKMSKSRGNVADPIAAMDKWGPDAIRCYLMRRGGNSAVDSDYSRGEVEAFFRKDLAGQLGNLAARLSPRVISRLPAGAQHFVAPLSFTAEDHIILEKLAALPLIFETHMSNLSPHLALAELFSVLSQMNKRLQEVAPWRSDVSALQVHQVLFATFESVRIAGILLLPFMPIKAGQLLDSLGVKGEGREWSGIQLGLGGECVMPKKEGKKGDAGVLFPLTHLKRLVAV